MRKIVRKRLFQFYASSGQLFGWLLPDGSFLRGAHQALALDWFIDEYVDSVEKRDVLKKTLAGDADEKKWRETGFYPRDLEAVHKGDWHSVGLNHGWIRIDQSLWTKFIETEISTPSPDNLERLKRFLKDSLKPGKKYQISVEVRGGNTFSTSLDELLEAKSLTDLGRIPKRDYLLRGQTRSLGRIAKILQNASSEIEKLIEDYEIYSFQPVLSVDKVGQIIDSYYDKTPGGAPANLRKHILSEYRDYQENHGSPWHEQQFIKEVIAPGSNDSNSQIRAIILFNIQNANEEKTFKFRSSIKDLAQKLVDEPVYFDIVYSELMRRYIRAIREGKVKPTMSNIREKVEKDRKGWPFKFNDYSHWE